MPQRALVVIRLVFPAFRRYVHTGNHSGAGITFPSKFSRHVVTFVVVVWGPVYGPPLGGPSLFGYDGGRAAEGVLGVAVVCPMPPDLGNEVVA